MKIFFLILLSFFLFTNITHAQFANKTYQMESIYLKNTKYVKNGIEQPIGLFGGKLKSEFQATPMALIEYEKFQKNRLLSTFLSLGGVAAAFVGIAMDNPNTRDGLLIAGLGMTIIAVPISIKSTNQLQKSIWLRNGEILN